VTDWNNKKRVFPLEPKPTGTAGRAGYDLKSKMGLTGKSQSESAKERAQALQMKLFYDQLEVSFLTPKDSLVDLSVSARLRS
jgi:hypothetical protein